MDLGKAKAIMQELTDALRELKKEKNSILMELERAKELGESKNKRTDKVLRWLMMVDRIEQEVAAIQSDYKRRKSGILGIPNYYGIHRIAIRAAKLLERVTELNQLRVSVERIVYESSYFDEVCCYLEEEEEEEEEGGIVGIVGPRGVGKSSLLKTLKYRFLEHPSVKGLFDHVIIVAVSKGERLFRLQNDIGNSLGTCSRNWESQAFEIYNCLKEKNFLLLIDDVWQEVDLEAIGIPDPCGGDRKWRRKVVITSRSEEVCARMNSHKIIKMDGPAVMTTDTSELEMTLCSVDIQTTSEEEQYGGDRKWRRKVVLASRSEEVCARMNSHKIIKMDGPADTSEPEMILCSVDIQTTSEEEQTESSHGNKICNFREEWRSLEVSYSDIKDATKGLSKSSRIGKGGYGTVYKGKLGGTMVAIKMLYSTSKQGEKEFFEELEVLYQMWHPNLVKLVGACFEVNDLAWKIA